MISKALPLMLLSTINLHTNSNKPTQLQTIKHTKNYSNNIIDKQYYVKGVEKINNQTLVSWSHSDDINIWEHDTCNKTWSCKEIVDYLPSIHFIKKTIQGFIVSSGKSNLNVYTYPQKQLSSQELNGHKGIIYNVKELKNGNILVCSNDKSIYVYSYNKKDKIWNSKKIAHDIYVKEIIELEDGTLVASSISNKLYTWNYETEDKSWSAPQLIGIYNDIHHIEKYKNGFVISSGTNNMHICTYNKTINSWGTQKLISHNNMIYCTQKTLKDGRILSWANSKTLYVCSYDKLKKTWGSQELLGHTAYIRGAFQRKDGRIVSWANDHTIRVWSYNKKYNTWSSQELSGHIDYIQDVVNLENGDIVSCAIDNTIRIWSEDNNTWLPQVIDADESTIGHLIPQSHGSFASWSGDCGSLQMWSKQIKQ